MDTLLTVVTPLLIAVLGIMLFTLARRDNKRKNEQLNRCAFIIRSSYSWGVIMIIIEVLLGSLLVFGNIGEPFSIGINIALSIFLLIFGFGILQAFREKVAVNGDNIVYTPTIGKKQEYVFSDIEKLESKRTGVYIYVRGKKAFTLDPSGIGTALFVEIYKTRK
ncbi:MAG: hypothetical protein E7596_02535 [Ruminococcaceae bacterium]|nr:hypothetical protein [Oscillospiraceae bacterium]